MSESKIAKPKDKTIEERVAWLLEKWRNSYIGEDQDLQDKITVFAQEVRSEALEEAAEVCELSSRQWDFMTETEVTDAIKEEVSLNAVTIRALKDKS